MKTTTSMFVAALALAASQTQAAPSAAEIAQLGASLTPWGAEKAGNADGSIPAYTGGLTQPPASYDPAKPGWRPDPYAADKPLYTIDSKNMAKYADKLSPGTAELLRKYPDFRIDIFPTRRSAAYPQEVLDNSVANASRCSLNQFGGLENTENCRGGIPFPIPKTGPEVIWNIFARYYGKAIEYQWSSSYVKPTGEVVSPSVTNRQEASGFYYGGPVDWRGFTRTEYTAPARLRGQATLWKDMYEKLDRQSWTYSPGTRRVRLSPDLAADTPIGALGGAVVYDEAYLFDGNFERFDFKLVGKQEMYIPYNNYKLIYADANSSCNAAKDLLKPNHPNPECIRWELRRVWHVKGTLKPGQRHVFSERDIYVEEDAWYGGLHEGRDTAGKLYHVTPVAIAPSYDIKAPAQGTALSFDLSSGIYVYNALGVNGNRPVEPPKANQMRDSSLMRFVLNP
ncbi:DUF1329 domain-containing protein [Pseudomonas capeferrum]|uniref:DUF1329 domain-containing protein n=1 Tax=Pseudomonas capeferrum TaxID=1495066 RepID=UPI0015E3401A|nr:DUF1329 domain-containing protein [Pseudomonas capeferrum]MBA1204824.1 DUF1329 domain-containing protein [Pseudomonas capeferrum]